MPDAKGAWGLVAEFDSVPELVRAAGAVYREGYRRIDAYTPTPVHGLAEAMGHDDRRLSLLTLLGGIAGLVAGYGLCYWTSVIDYPVNVGGRPLHSWPAFVVPTFETTILFASLTCFFAMLALCGFPQPYHPVFNVDEVRKHATSDGLFLSVESADPRFERAATERLLQSLGARAVHEVEE